MKQRTQAWWRRMAHKYVGNADGTCALCGLIYKCGGGLHY